MQTRRDARGRAALARSLARSLPRAKLSRVTLFYFSIFEAFRATEPHATPDPNDIIRRGTKSLSLSRNGGCHGLTRLV